MVFFAGIFKVNDENSRIRIQDQDPGSGPGSESGSISQRHGSADPDPDPTPKCHGPATLVISIGTVLFFACIFVGLYRTVL